MYSIYVYITVARNVWYMMYVYVKRLQVPLLYRGCFASAGQLQKCLEKWKTDSSAVGADVHPEGFVVRRAASISQESFSEEVAKYVRANHIQTDEAWKRKWKKAVVGPQLEQPLRQLEPEEA